MISEIQRALGAIRTNRPLVHNITNYVVMNYTANALIALGASPVMAHAPEEVDEMTALAGALVVNIGTLSTPWIDAMVSALQTASRHHIPSVLDPVGAGATVFRTETSRRLIKEGQITVLRGNASEIMAVSGLSIRTKGVDSLEATDSARAAAAEYARTYGLVISVTGEEDFITNGTEALAIQNGHPLMSRITGTGCTATAITGAFCAVCDDPLIASAGALVTLGIAGELAAQTDPGPGTFAARLLDSLYAIDDDRLFRLSRIKKVPVR